LYLLYESIEPLLNLDLVRLNRFARLPCEDVDQHRDVTMIHQQIEHLAAGNDHSEQHVDIVGEIVGIVHRQDQIHQLRQHKRVYQQNDEDRVRAIGETLAQRCPGARSPTTADH